MNNKGNRSIRAKRVFTTGEIKNILNDKNKLYKTIQKVKKTHLIFRKLLGKADKLAKTYQIICTAAKAFKTGRNLLQAQKTLKTADETRTHFREVGKNLTQVATIMKGVTSVLPRGASDYCDFIFTVAENAGKAFKIVDDYTSKILEATDFKNMNSNWQKIEDRRDETSNYARRSITLD